MYMENLNLPITAELPSVSLNSSKGEFILKGRSVAEDAQKFYEKITHWLNDYSKSPAPLTHFIFHLDYFNISSSKAFLFILYKMLELQETGKAVKVTWIYSDAYILGAGRDYAYMVKIPFEFQKATKRENAAA